MNRLKAVETKNPKGYENAQILSYDEWKKRLIDVVPNEEPVKDHVIYHANVFEKAYRENHGTEPVEKTYNNGNRYLLDKLFSQDLENRETFVPVMITLQEMTYVEFKKSK